MWLTISWFRFEILCGQSRVYDEGSWTLACEGRSFSMTKLDICSSSSGYWKIEMLVPWKFYLYCWWGRIMVDIIDRCSSEQTFLQWWWANDPFFIVMKAELLCNIIFYFYDSILERQETLQYPSFLFLDEYWDDECWQWWFVVFWVTSIIANSVSSNCFDSIEFNHLSQFDHYVLSWAGYLIKIFTTF